MIGNLKTSFFLPALLATILTANAQQAPDPRVADLVRAGQVRVALFLPQYTENPTTGEIRGDVHLVEIARALAARLGVKLVLVDYPTPKTAVEGLKAGSCDVAFMGIDRSRTGELGFSPPFAELDFTYGAGRLFNPQRRRRGPTRGPHRAIRNHELTLALSRILKHATLVYTDTPEPAFDLLKTGRRNVGLSRLCTSAVFRSITRLTGVGRPLRGKPPGDSGCERRSRKALLYQRVRRGGEGIWAGSASYRPRWLAWDSRRTSEKS